jgi:tetratricopeptide (TPR) repeat protein
MEPWTPRRRAPRLTALVATPLLVGTTLLAGCGSPPPTPVNVAASTLPASATPDPSPPAASPSSSPGALIPTDSPTQARINYLLQRVTVDPKDGDAQLDLGLSMLQRIRETADPSLYRPAETALVAARRLLPKDPAPFVGLGGLQLGQHRFASALKTGRAALALDPDSIGAGSVVFDALIELGRYDAAFKAIDGLVGKSVDLTTLSRLSYARELRGDLPGALDAMHEAARAPSLAPENTAFALGLVGQLERLDGDPAAARTAYETALSFVPNHAPSLAGLGRLAVGDGDLATAADRFEQAAAILPLPEYVIALGETREAAGDGGDAKREYDLARAEIELFKAAGVTVDLDLALFEADHGDPLKGLGYAKAAYRATPTVRAADALAWCLYRVGRVDEAVTKSAEALRLGSREPLFLYHAGAIAAADDDPGTARKHLEAALSIDPGFSATGAHDARALLADLPSGG